jgi:ubiquitin-protein ligase
MSVSPEQLSEIHRKLKESFLSHPVISIKPTKGDPPEQYEITYNLSGFSKPGNDEASLATGHIIQLTIPFGFPHFPPSCKPKSDIYHPDFDPAAICLGDFWQQQSHVTDLIVFIGKLINGEHYSTTNAFNEDAALWYKSHSDLFPIAKINWSKNEEDSFEHETIAKPQIDTIDDADLSPDFNFLAIEEPSPNEEPPANTSFAAIESPSATDLGLLQLLENQKKFFKLRQLLGRSTGFSDQMEKLSARTEEEIQKAEKLYRSAKKAENVENLKNASNLYEQVGAIASDYPNLEADQKRVLEALTLRKKASKAIVPDTTATNLPDQPDNETPAADLSSKGSSKHKQRKEPSKQYDSFLSDNRQSSRLFFSLTTGFFTVILVISGCYYFYAARQLDAADAALVQCTTSIDSGQFDGAKQSCESALESMSSVKIILQNRSKELKNRVNAVLVSEKLSQGLAGNIFVDGKYYPKKDAATLTTYKQLFKEGEEFFAQANWTEAEERFTKILAISSTSTLIPPATTDEIKSKLSFVRFSMVFGFANTLLANHKWQEASTELDKAKKLLEALPEKDQQRYAVELSSALAKCNFEEFRKQGDDFFSKADWLNALSTYKSVLPTVAEGNVAPQETIDALRENISRAELYATIDMGNKAFTAGSWDEAIEKYHMAASILTANQGIIRLADAQLTRKKIDRIILQTTIIRDRQTAKTLQDDKKDLAAARNTYRQIVANINNSGYAAEDEFLETKKTCLTAIQTLDEKIFLSDKEQYLRDNFRTIFVANYPTAVPENLNNPAVSFVKEVDNKIVFKLQCTETGRGRPLTLVLFYAYDKTGKRWDFYSEQQ